MPRFLLTVDISAHGYIELDAADEAEAREKAENMDVGIDISEPDQFFSSIINDLRLDLRVYGCSPVKEEEEEEEKVKPDGLS